MKKFLFAIAAATLLAPLAMAAPAGQGPVRPAPGGPPVGGPEAMMAKVLELTPAQESKWNAERERGRAAVQPLWEQLGKQTAELKELLDRKAADDQVKAKVDATNATRLAIRGEQDKHEANLMAVLTPLQQARFLMMFADRLRQGWGRAPMMGPRGGMPGGPARPR